MPFELLKLLKQIIKALKEQATALPHIEICQPRHRSHEPSAFEAIAAQREVLVGRGSGKCRDLLREGMDVKFSLMKRRGIWQQLDVWDARFLAEQLFAWLIWLRS